MNTLWNAIGRTLFWLSWPLLWVYLRRSKRTRIVIIHDDKLLVIKTWVGDGRWSLPGGGLHGREAVEQGARRELLEETGLDIPARALHWVSEYQGSTRGLGFHYTLLRLDTDYDLDISTVRPQRVEIREVRWLSRSELAAAKVRPEVQEALAIWTP